MNTRNKANTIKWIKDSMGIYRTKDYTVDIAKAGKVWIVTTPDETFEYPTLKAAKQFAENGITVRIEYIDALDQEMSFTMQGWLEELALREEVKAEKAAYLASLEEAPSHVGIESDEEAADRAKLEQMLADDEGEDDEEETYSSRMAKALAKARPTYVKSKCASGKVSLHNGDSLATLLAECEPSEVAQLADLVCQTAAGYHIAKYGHLNQGQIRMNSGNKIRGRIKRGEILTETVIEVAKANLPTLLEQA